MDDKSTQLVDSRGKPIEKSIYGECGNSMEGQWRGPFMGMGELGGWYPFERLGDGWQKNIAIPGFDACAAAFAAINTIAQTVATIPMYHHRKLDNHGRELITTSALSRILYQPNWYQTYSDFMLNLIFALLTHGNAYAMAYRNERQEVESLHLMSPRQVMPYIDPETQEVFYAVGENPMLAKIDVLIPARDVLHLKLHTPRHPLVGVSPIQYAGMAIHINTSISSNQGAFFSNMSRPSGVLTTDEKLTKEQMDSLRAAWNRRSQGMNAGEVPVLSWGLKWQAMTITSEDAQLLEAYRMSIEDIARVFRVPLMLIGDYTKATYSNSEQLISSWLATGLGFILEHVERGFAKFFKLPQDQIVDFDVNVLLRTDLEARMRAYSTAATSGIMAPNEIRAREGLASVEFGDEPRVQQQNVPLSAVGQMPDPAPAPEAPPPAPQPTAEENAFVEWSAKQAILKEMAA